MPTSDAALPGPADARLAWWAVADGSLDVRYSDAFDGGAEVVVVPVGAVEPVSLIGHGAELWRRLVESGPWEPSALDAADVSLLEEMRVVGLTHLGGRPPTVVTDLRVPTLSSPLHELVYGVVGNVARERGIRCVFIKGPTLHLQGLREREHSGDVDVWCQPDRWDELAEALATRGWRREADPWRGTSVNHSATMTPLLWGCEIDVHRRMPGAVHDDERAFAALWRHSSEVCFAGVRVRVPTPPMHAVVSALHGVRPEIGRLGRDAAGSENAVRLLARPGTLACAKDLGAVVALRTELLEVVSPSELRGYDQGTPRDWVWRGQPDRVRAYWVALREQRLWLRLRLMFRLLWPNADVAAESARRAGDRAGGSVRARLRRIVRGARGWLRTSLRR
ncbi:MAG: nucleotidyltransferase family protein [Actinobacteria bacterium]|nr:nucleotidyltransferase family protein [Actinomycetota bacterium]